MKILKSSRHYVHVTVDDGGGSSWLCTVVYVNPKDQLKKRVF
jgi:hypothetical protein